jgi:hypothetical protein
VGQFEELATVDPTEARSKGVIRWVPDGDCLAESPTTRLLGEDETSRRASTR